MVTVLPNKNTTPYMSTGFQEYQDQFSTGNQSVDYGPSLPPTVYGGENIKPPATEETTEIASPSVEQNLSQDTGFRVPTDSEVTTQDLGTTEDQVYQMRDQLASQAEQNLTQVTSERDQLRQNVIASMRALTGKSARQLQLEAEAGVPEDTAEIGSLRREIADISTQMDVEMNRRDLGITQRSILGEQSRIERRYLAEIGNKTAMIQVLQGNIELARQTAERAVNMEYESVENELQVQIQELMFKEEDLSNAEQKVLEEAQSKQAEIEQQRKDREAIYAAMFTAAENGASQDVVNSILSATSLEEAYKLTAPYVGAYERSKMESSLADAALNRRAKLFELAMAGDTSAQAQLGATWSSIQRQIDMGMSESEIIANTNEFNTVKRKENLVQKMIQNTEGFGASTGAIRSGWWNVAGGAAAGTGLGVAAGTVVPGIGNVVGGAGGFVLGTVGGFQSKARIDNARGDFLSDLGSLVSQETLDELVRRKNAGATFGALDKQEFNALQASSLDLAARIERDNNGNIIGLSGSPDVIQQELNTVIAMYQKAAEELNIDVLDDDSSNEVDNIFK